MITQSEIADRLGITGGRLSQIFAGDNPGVKTASKMSQLTGLPWHVFIDMDREQMRGILETACQKAVPNE